MSIESLPTSGHEEFSPSEARPLKNCFSIKNGVWFVTNADNEQAGPYSNKYDAQIALVYYVAQTCWPSAKQLREFARSGH